MQAMPKLQITLEPTQELYLNGSTSLEKQELKARTDTRVVFKFWVRKKITICNILEPTQELYLNDLILTLSMLTRQLEPTQELYLNL